MRACCRYMPLLRAAWVSRAPCSASTASSRAPCEARLAAVTCLAPVLSPLRTEHAPQSGPPREPSLESAVGFCSVQEQQQEQQQAQQGSCSSPPGRPGSDQAWRQ
eukprot:scaffold25981_cov54-Phaeocystis_antarctica.AAC.4